MFQSSEMCSHWLGVPISVVEGLAYSRGSGSTACRWNCKRWVVSAQRTQENADVPESSIIGKKSYALPLVQGSKRVVLVRHGQSTWNEIGRIQGSSDISRLTPKGEQQAEISRQMLLSDSFDVCIHSPLSRAKRTAEIIWGPARDPRDMISLDDLREIDLYSFQGLYKEQGKELFGEVYTKWKKDPVNFAVDSHYPVCELWERASRCWSSILSQKGSSVLVVAHNAVNQALLATAIGLGPTYFRHLLQSNCGVSVLDFTPRNAAGPAHVCLERLNQTPISPLSGGQSSGLKTRPTIMLLCPGATGTSLRKQFPSSASEPLSPLGIVQSTKVAEYLLSVPMHSVFCSPEACTAKTADFISQNMDRADLKVTPLEELKDLEWGTWRGRHVEEVVTSGVGGRWQDEVQRNWSAGAETFDSFWARTAEAWQMLVQHLDRVQRENADDGTVVVVGHSVVNEAMLCHLLALDPTYFGSFQFDNGSLSVIDFPDGALGGGVVRCLNCTAHLGRWAVPVTRKS